MHGIYIYIPETKHVSSVYSVAAVLYLQFILHVIRAFFLGGRGGTRTPKHFVNLTGESKNFK